MKVSWLLALLGTLAGLYYAGLGVAASAQFKDKSVSSQDRFLSAMTLWSVSTDRYNSEG